MWILCILQFFINSALSQQILSFEYLRGVPRLDDSSYMDYYFSCRVIAPRHSYSINGISSRFTGAENAGSVLRNSAANLDNYIVLISKSSVGNSNYTYDTMLVVSTTMPNVALDIAVNCFADRTFQTLTISDMEGAGNFANISRSSDTVFMQYLFSTNISEGTTTHVYTCGVNNTLLAWQATDLVTLSFRSSRDSLGGSVPGAVSSTVAPQTAIWYSLQPYPLTSLLYVTVPGAIDVMCGISGAVSERVNGSEVLQAIAAAALQDSFTSTETMFSSIPTTNASIPTESHPGGCDRTCLLASAVATPIGVVLVIVIVVVAVLIGIGCCGEMKINLTSRNRVEQPLSATPPDEVKDTSTLQEDGVNSVV